MKPLSEVAPGLLVIQTPIQALCNRLIGAPANHHLLIQCETEIHFSQINASGIC